MIKQIVIIVLVLILIVLFCCGIKEPFKTTPGQVKYPIKKKYPYNTKKLTEIKSDDIFFVDYPWTTKFGNYIHSLKEDRYYIIEKGFYYNIPDPESYHLTIVKNVNVNFFKIK
jgi:hypothetical protein